MSALRGFFAQPWLIVVHAAPCTTCVAITVLVAGDRALRGYEIMPAVTAAEGGAA